MAFRSEGAATAWGRRRPEAPDAARVVPVEVLGRVSAAWYAGRFDDAWRPSPPAAKHALLERAGLRGPFWKIA